MTSFLIYTLGCKVNQCDSESIAQKLVDYGLNRKKPTESADLLIINTCVVTSAASAKSLQIIRRFKNKNLNGQIAVCGCMAHAGTQNLPELPVDFVFDARSPDKFLSEIKSKIHSSITENSHTLKTRGFVKISDGCDRFCSYCIVPYVRGGIKSTPIKQIIDTVKTFTDSGVKEIVLTGIQTAAFGKDTGENLPKLIRELSEIKDLKRVRFSSIDPWAVDDEFLPAVNDSSNLLDHFHLSLQSGCDKTLHAMNRRYTANMYKKNIDSLRKIRPNASFTTDIIVGFPDETDEDFLQSLDFIKSLGFLNIHVFEYSIRKGTKAAELPNQINSQVKKERSKIVRELSNEMQETFLENQIGKTVNVLFEKKYGLTETYCKVMAPGSKQNEIQKVMVTSVKDDFLTGYIKEDSE